MPLSFLDIFTVSCPSPINTQEQQSVIPKIDLLPNLFNVTYHGQDEQWRSKHRTKYEQPPHQQLYARIRQELISWSEEQFC